MQGAQSGTPLRESCGRGFVPGGGRISRGRGYPFIQDLLCASSPSLAFPGALSNAKLWFLPTIKFVDKRLLFTLLYPAKTGVP